MLKPTTIARRDGLYLLFIGAAIFLLLGGALARTSGFASPDFQLVYTGARCLFHHLDPYKQDDFLRVYLANGGRVPADAIQHQQFPELMRYIYPPTSLVIAPLAVLPFGLANALWLTLMAGGLILASFLMWDLASPYAPILSGALLCCILASSQLFLIIGNSAGLVISFCAIAVWCFLKNRFVPAGILCLAIALLLKPHDAGLVWLFFLLSGKLHRKRALQTLAVALALATPTIFWAAHVAPHWFQELRANLAVDVGRGGYNDPGPNSLAGHHIGMIVSLQTIFSLYRDDPHFYNLATYAVCGVLFLIWAIVTLRSRPTPERTAFALAAIAALSLLPVYHRLYDTKLLLLTVPACAILWARGGRLRWLALAITGTGVLLIGDLQWGIFFAILDHLTPPHSLLMAKILVALQIVPVPGILLILSIFYIWVYLRTPDSEVPAGGPGPSKSSTIRLNFV